MPPLPKEIISILEGFAPVFSKRVWKSAKLLLIGALLCQGRRTVTTALRVMGLSLEKRFEKYHRVLSRASWSCKQTSKIMLGLIIMLLPENWPIIIGVDDTLERRKGKQIKMKGSYRDPLRSSHSRTVACYGLKWLSMMLIVPTPWSKRPWALPFLTVLVPSEKYNQSVNKKHKTITEWTMQIVGLVSRWLKREWILVGDGHFGSARLALKCVNNGVTLVSRLRLDARLFDFAEVKSLKKVGRPSPAGKRLPTLDKFAEDNPLAWEKHTVRWYHNEYKELEIISGICLWYAAKLKPFPIRWVLVKNPKKDATLDAFFSTDIKANPVEILQHYVLRWNVEVTFQESRQHLGIETQRQWSDKAIQRTTPLLFGLYSLVCLMAFNMKVHTQNFTHSCAWYVKDDFATFSDVLTVVRRKIWLCRYFSTSQFKPDFVKLPANDFDFIVYQLAGVT